ncbi:hypothetical protein DASC09_062330 [Saccharomycopsis crataegensis]|uniref:Uncharacterized protein n=1 Tax=Saccharomycopsis crataegensis TaxID=43959 RepID=A0AAV5QWH4_9ASCO|nr:hypothetical protein DASC09_062330 [Saccharomycopsis crataegensis]
MASSLRFHLPLSQTANREEEPPITHDAFIQPRLHRAIGSVAKRVLINSAIESDNFTTLNESFDSTLRTLESQMMAKSNTYSQLRESIEEKIELINSRFDNEYEMIDSSMLKKLQEDRDFQSSKLQQLEVNIVLLLHFRAAVDLCKLKINRVELKSNIEKKYRDMKFEDLETNDVDKNTLSHLTQQENRSRNRHAFVMDDENSMAGSSILFMRPSHGQKRIYDRVWVDADDKLKIARTVRRKIVADRKKRNPWFSKNVVKDKKDMLLISHENGLNIFQDHHCLYCSLKQKYSANLDSVSSFYNERISAGRLYDELPMTKSAISSNEFVPSVNALNDHFKFSKTRATNLLLRNGLQFSLDASKLESDIGLKILFEYLYPIHNDSKEIAFKKFIQKLSLNFTIGGSDGISPKFLQGKLRCNFQLYKFWLFNNFNFLEELKQMKLGKFSKASEILKFENDSTLQDDIDELQFNVKVINFEEIGLIDIESADGDSCSENNVPSEATLSINDSTKHKCLNVDSFEEFINIVLNSNELMRNNDEYRHISSGKIRKWKQLRPFDNISTYFQFLRIMLCNNCLKFLQENFTLLEWSLLDINNKFSNYSNNKRSRNFDEDKYFGDHIFFNNSEFSDEHKYNYHELVKFGSFSADEFINQLSKVKLLVIINKHTNEVDTIKYKPFPVDCTSNQLMEDYTSIIEKFPCLIQGPQTSSNFSFC